MQPIVLFTAEVWCWGVGVFDVIFVLCIIKVPRPYKDVFLDFTYEVLTRIQPADIDPERRTEV